VARPVDEPPLTFAVTGRRPLAGKSTLVLGLARAWAEAGHRVLVVDAGSDGEVARLLQYASTAAPRSPHSLLHALREGEPVWPCGTVLDGVDLVLGGAGTPAEEVELAQLADERADALARALAPACARHGRVIIDTPSSPLATPLCIFSDFTLPIVPCERDAADAAAEEPPQNRLGILLTRWGVTTGPDPRWIASAWERRPCPWLDTVIPSFTGVTDLWDVVAAEPSSPVPRAFARLAAEIDERAAVRTPARLREDR
jgi:hypothetical protein